MPPNCHSGDRPRGITFLKPNSRGGNFGPARYGLEPGLYTFTNTDHGWELYHGAVAQPSVVQTPSNTLPMNRTPSAVVPMIPPAPGLVK